MGRDLNFYFSSPLTLKKLQEQRKRQSRTNQEHLKPTLPELTATNFAPEKTIFHPSIAAKRILRYHYELKYRHCSSLLSLIRYDDVRWDAIPRYEIRCFSSSYPTQPNPTQPFQSVLLGYMSLYMGTKATWVIYDFPLRIIWSMLIYISSQTAFTFI